MKFITKLYLQLFRRNKFESNTYRASVTGRLAKKKKANKSDKCFFGKCTVIHMNFSFHSLLFHYSHDTSLQVYSPITFSNPLKWAPLQIFFNWTLFLFNLL